MTQILIRSCFATLTLALVVLPSAFAQGTERVSINSAGVEGNLRNSSPSISADGSFIAFSSESDNLVPGDTNLSEDVFLHDRSTGKTRRVSVSSVGIEGNRDSRNPSISADGRFIAFESDANNLVAGVGFGQVYVHDRIAGTTYCASVNSGGMPGNDRSRYPSISGSGHLIAFASDANNLDLNAADTNFAMDVFLHDFLTGQTRRISVVSGGGQAGGATSPSLSADGRYCAFQSASDMGVAIDTNGMPDIFVHDVQTVTTSLVSHRWDVYYSGNGSSLDASISNDGSIICYFSTASNLVANDTNGQTDIFVWNRLLGQTTIASVSSVGSQGAWSSFYPNISADGRFVSFTSQASNLVLGDTNNADDVFVRDLALGHTERANVDSLGIQANGGYYGTSFSSISANGRFVSFSSEATNLVPGDTNNALDVFVHDFGASGPRLAKTGTCPGAITLTISSATAGGLIAIVSGPAGNFVQQSLPCQGLVLVISPPTLRALLSANGSGAVVLNFNAPAGACGLSVQAVDITSCTATNAIVL